MTATRWLCERCSQAANVFHAACAPQIVAAVRLPICSAAPSQVCCCLCTPLALAPRNARKCMARSIHARYVDPPALLVVLPKWMLVAGLLHTLVCHALIAFCADGWEI